MIPASEHLASAVTSIIICDADQGDWHLLAGHLADHPFEWVDTMVRSREVGRKEIGRQEPSSPLIEAVDRCDAPVHLVGRAVGGAIALEVARRRANRIASLTLVDPCAFHLLRSMGPVGMQALSEMTQAAGDEGVHRPGGRMRLDVFRRLALPTLLIETGSAAPAVALLMRRLHAVSRRGRYERLDAGGFSHPGAMTRAIIGSAAAHIRQRSNSVPAVRAVAA